MKKSSIAIVIVVLIAALSGVIYLTRPVNKEETADREVQETQETYDASADITFFEQSYSISDTEKINAKCMKSSSGTSIYSIYPVPDKQRYDISSSGRMALYLSTDNSIWLLNSDGTERKLTPDEYNGTSKLDILKKNPDFLWAYSPQFTVNNSVRFISDLPGGSNTSVKSIWEISLDDKTIRKLYTPVSDSYKLLGERADGKCLILDGTNLIMVDYATETAESMDEKDKYILTLSPDGKRIIYAERDQGGVPDFSKLRVVDSNMQNEVDVPSLGGYTSLESGAWAVNSSRYAFVVKSGSGDGVAVIDFSEESVSIAVYKPEEKAVFPENCQLGWMDDNTVSVDYGDGMVCISTISE